jgi:hypothetical protein
VESEDKKRSRINVINHILRSVPWEHVDHVPPTIPERPEVAGEYVRPPRAEFRYVPDVASDLEREAVAAKKSKKGKKKKKHD